MGGNGKGAGQNRSCCAHAECCEESADDLEHLTCTGSDQEVAEIGALLVSAARHSLSPPERTGNGYRLHLAPSKDLVRTLREFARRDKACCSFLDFEIEEGTQEVRLDVVGPSEANEILDLCFAAATTAIPSVPSATEGR
jgi:hypothetical protein